MKLYFYRGDRPNFGDELNTWLLPKVFPDFFDDDEAHLFLGIGSVIFDIHPAEAVKIVFGSGYAGYTVLPRFDETWKIFCVRGPRTADACGLSRDKVAADTAVLMRDYRDEAVEKTIRRSFMPHWESLVRGNWREVCESTGFHLIDPRSSIEDVLHQIQSSEVLITEAMHGAIVADALRVPWVAIEPLHKSHRMKWFDWAEALDISLRPQTLTPSSSLEAWNTRTNRYRRFFEHPPRLARAVLGPVDRWLIDRAATRLRQAAQAEPQLSADAALSRGVEQLLFRADQIKTEFRTRG